MEVIGAGQGAIGAGVAQPVAIGIVSIGGNGATIPLHLSEPPCYIVFVAIGYRLPLDRLLDAAILSGGPPHADMAKGCVRSPETKDFWYPGWAARIMDEAARSYLDRTDPPRPRAARQA